MGRFLEALAETGNVTDACRMSGLPRRTAYDLRDRDVEFAERWEDALDQAADVLEAEAHRRALQGVEEPVFYQGGVVGHVRRYSDAVLMFLLRGNRPEKYAPNRIDPQEIRKEAQREMVNLFADFLKQLALRHGLPKVTLLKEFQRSLQSGEGGS